MNTEPRIYRGYPDGRVTVTKDHGEQPLNPRLDLFNHSPTGFAWGYSGSGPAQLALAIAADLVGDERAVRAHQQLKERIIAPLRQGEPFALHSAGILNEIEIIEGRA